MLKLMGVIFFLNYILLSDSVVVQIKGPTHRNFALQCLDQISTHAYNYTKSKSAFYSVFLLTFVVTKHLNSPGFEIQEDILRVLHQQTLWTIEALQYGREDFVSYSENCIRSKIDLYSTNGNPIRQPPNCIRKHVTEIKTHVYFIVVDELDMFYKKVDHITKTSNFNSEALYVIHFTKININNFDIASKIIHVLYENDIRKMVVMIPDDIIIFSIYTLQIKNNDATRCYVNFNTKLSFQCKKGILLSRGKNIFERNEKKNFFNCIVDVKALPQVPFVISETSGLEVDVVNLIGEALNISFEIQVYPNATIDLNEKHADGSWAGFLKSIFDEYAIGIGNVAIEEELLKDFTYSFAFTYPKLIYVVPSADLIPRWRVLLIIFSVEMWAICLAVIFGFAIAFYLCKERKEVNTFKTFEKCVSAAYQIIIAHPLPIQPISNFVRVYYISLAVFAIIMNAVYTSSLIDYLQNPKWEHQISTQTEIAQSYLAVGGSSKYKDMFRSSASKSSKMILESYQTVNESSETYSYWLEKVASERNIATISIKLYVDYLLSKNNPIVSYKNGHPKIFILRRELRTQPASIIMRRNIFIKTPINSVLQRVVVESGILGKIKENYLRSSLESEQKEDFEDSNHQSDGGVTALTPHHLEGAFAILALGAACALLAFVIELACYHVGRAHKKKQNNLLKIE